MMKKISHGKIIHWSQFCYYIFSGKRISIGDKNQFISQIKEIHREVLQPVQNPVQNQVQNPGENSKVNEKEVVNEDERKIEADNHGGDQKSGDKEIVKENVPGSKKRKIDADKVGNLIHYDTESDTESAIDTPPEKKLKMDEASDNKPSEHAEENGDKEMDEAIYEEIVDNSDTEEIGEKGDSPTEESDTEEMGEKGDSPTEESGTEDSEGELHIPAWRLI